MRLFLVILFSAILNMVSAQSAGSMLKVGNTAPDFSGIDQSGTQIMLGESLKSGPVVLIFFRGSWCPYCNRHLSQLQDSLSLIIEKGASVITVSPQLSEYAEKTIDKTGATFSILHDKDYKIMDDYHVSFQLDEKTIRRYSRFNLDEVNGNEDNMLPVPATFIIDKDGKIVYIQYDPDYKNRSTVAEILNYL
jgi:peroxiredoxin